MSLYDLSINTLEGKPADLSSYKGKVALVVNVASACGLTPHYTGLQKLHDELAARSFTVLGFPSNQFGAQEPGSAAQIREFCTTRYGVTFPLFEKIEVKKGPSQHPVYQFLTSSHAEPNWNFTKYLISKDGNVIKRYEPTTTPDDPGLLQDIADALA
ncbi:MAG: glutathione peroxidase [Planctomycetes bacterium]|nr:glutathione peroxidase [Planctomycetota bacterium]MCW8134910.1 glutathione peroxidase [Planctomycetota bacterium]